MSRSGVGRTRILTIVWGPFGFRADELAESVGAERVSITFLYGPRYFAPLRYLVLFFKTLVILGQRSPDVVYAQNPPVFCPLTCLLYCRLAGKKLVIDHHSIWRVKTLGGSPLSRAIGFLEAFVSRAAAGNTAPHSFWGDKLRAMGASNVLVVHDYVERNPNPRDDAIRRQYTDKGVVAVCSHGGHPLERIETEASAVGRVGSVALLITGPREKLEHRLSSFPLPPNVEYLGFLPRQPYESLKASADFAINITDEPFTLSHVLLEYAASSLPVVSSRQDVLEDFFGDSLLYTDSSDADEVASKVRMMLDEGVRADYRSRISRWYGALSASRQAELAELKSLLDR
jgi:glycosyltransferase involved in cell wall biosynthesis